MPSTKILCIGTTPAAQRVMIFRKLTPDAVNRAVTTLDGVAGKAINVAKILKALGAHPVATGFLGGQRGEFLRAVMAEKQIESDFVTVKAPTRQCITVIDESAGTHTELVEESRPVGPADFKKFMAVVRRHIAGCRAVVMSGTIASGGPATLYHDCVAAGGKRRGDFRRGRAGYRIDRGAQGKTGTGQTQPAGTGGDRRTQTQVRSGRDAGDARIMRTRRATGDCDGGPGAGAGV